MAKSLTILWVNDNPITAELMLFMYATNSLKFGWWEEVRIIVWGATVKLLTESEKMQELVQEFQKAGGKCQACLSCAEKLGKVEDLQKIEGIEIEYMGQPLTEVLKENNPDKAFMTI